MQDQKIYNLVVIPSAPKWLAVLNGKQRYLDPDKEAGEWLRSQVFYSGKLAGVMALVRRGNEFGYVNAEDSKDSELRTAYEVVEEMWERWGFGPIKGVSVEEG